MRRGDQSPFNESAQRCQTHRTCRHRDRNKLPLSDWIHLLHYGLNHITEMLNPKNVTGWRKKFKAVISYLFSQSNYPFDLNLNVRLRGFMVALNLLTDFAVVSEIIWGSGLSRSLLHMNLQKKKNCIILFKIYRNSIFYHGKAMLILFCIYNIRLNVKPKVIYFLAIWGQCIKLQTQLWRIIK